MIGAAAASVTRAWSQNAIAEAMVNPFGNLLRAGRLGKHAPASPRVACLLPLLEELGWQGSPRRVFEALPHAAKDLAIDDLRAVLVHLGYRSIAQPLRLRNIDARLMPCLFETDDGKTLVVRSRSEGKISLFDGVTRSWREDNRLATFGTAYFFEALPERSGEKKAASSGWFFQFVMRFRPVILLLLAISFVTNCFALAVPLFIMGVYDKVIAAGSNDTLHHFLSGMAIVILADTILRLVRSRALGYVGARLDVLLGGEVFGHILRLPLRMTEHAGVGSQISRLRLFEALREFFTGPLAGVVFDLPFVGLFIVVIALLGGAIVWVPVALLLAFVLMAVLLTPIMQRRIADSAALRQRRQTFLIELFNQHRSIRDCHAEDTWRRRLRDVSARHAMSYYRSQRLSLTVQTLAQSLMMAAGIATLGLGTLRVMEGALSPGALIAIMALTWRVLAPLQVGLLGLTRLEQIKTAIHQISRLLQLESEYDASRSDLLFRSFQGKCGFHRVSFRYVSASEPALLGVTLKIPAKQRVAIVGASGAGKSTLLKLLAGLYEPQSGFVTIDALDIRQMDKRELRGSFGYCPQQAHLFHGTIAQNIRLANPTASDAQVTKAAIDAGLLDRILAMPDGFDTWLTDAELHQLSESFKHQMMLARAYIADAPIYLFDEAAAGLDHDGDECFRRKIQALAGHATVIMVTHRPSHMRLADRVIYLEEGQILRDGTPDQVIPHIQQVQP